MTDGEALRERLSLDHIVYEDERLSVSRNDRGEIFVNRKRDGTVVETLGGSWQLAGVKITPEMSGLRVGFFGKATINFITISPWKTG